MHPETLYASRRRRERLATKGQRLASDKGNVCSLGTAYHPVAADGDFQFLTFYQITSTT